MFNDKQYRKIGDGPQCVKVYDYEIKSEKGMVLVKNLIEDGLYTGSRVLGGATKDSDFDFLVTGEAFGLHFFGKDIPEVSVDALNALCDEAAYGNGTKSIKFLVDGRVINFIVCKDQYVFKEWAQATEFYKRHITNTDFDKGWRIQLFQSIRQKFAIDMMEE